MTFSAIFLLTALIALGINQLRLSRIQRELQLADKRINGDADATAAREFVVSTEFASSLWRSALRNNGAK